MILRIGLTGGICCGKSTAANLFQQLGIEVIDADQIARQVVEPGQPGLQQVIAHFGDDIVDEQGQLNRKKLRSIIFDTPPERVWLENLLHPLIRQEIARQIEQVTTPYVIIAIPLLIENLPQPYIDRILLIDTSETEQIQRTMARDNITQAEAQKILASQASRQERLQHADDVINNDGSMDELQTKINCLHQDYLQLAAKTAK